MILRQVHDTNWKAKGEPERVFTVSQDLLSDPGSDRLKPAERTMYKYNV